jgi:hypothetical protein
LARELGAGTLADVGKLVNRDGGCISWAVRRLSEKMVANPELADRDRGLKADVMKYRDNLEDSLAFVNLWPLAACG